MDESKRRKFVVLIERNALDQASEIFTKLRQVAGVEVVTEGRSSVDITADENVVGQEELKGIVKELGGDLHALPEAQLMDPIPTKKIP